MKTHKEAPVKKTLFIFACRYMNSLILIFQFLPGANVFALTALLLEHSQKKVTMVVWLNSYII